MGRARFVDFVFNLSLGASSAVETLEQFFARLKEKYNWTDQGKMKAVLSDLRSREINTVEAFKELWEYIKPELPLSIGMKQSLEEEMIKEEEEEEEEEGDDKATEEQETGPGPGQEEEAQKHGKGNTFLTSDFFESFSFVSKITK